MTEINIRVDANADVQSMANMRANQIVIGLLTTFFASG